MLKFLQRGADAVAQIKQADALQEAKKAQQDAPWRYWLKVGGSGRITFLDGDLAEDGTSLSPVSYWEHDLKMGGKFGNKYACTQLTEPCPICEGGVDQPSLVLAFTILDHVPYTSKAKGTLFENTKKLFICKRETFKYLEKIAVKRGGLTGCTFDVDRTGDKSPNVGSHFDFIEKNVLPVLLGKYHPKDGVEPFDYNKALGYRDAAELRKLGFGIKSPLGHSDMPSAAPTVAPWEDDTSIEEMSQKL